MKNFVQTGDVLDLAAPYAVSSGDGALVGGVFGVAVGTLGNGETGAFRRVGVHKITALGTDVIAQGAKVYWDNTNKRITSTASGNTLVGAAVAAKANGETTCTVLLDGAVR